MRLRDYGKDDLATTESGRSVQTGCGEYDLALAKRAHADSQATSL
jgi:hypothetical protein